MTFIKSLIAIYAILLLSIVQCCSSFAPQEKCYAKYTHLPTTKYQLCASNNRADETSLNRRLVLATPAAFLLQPNVSNAATGETAAESIRLLSAKTIPGLGPPDIYYPPNFVGKWKVTRVITKSDEVFWDNLDQVGVQLPISIVSEMRFVPYDAGKDFSGSVDEESNPNSPAIADRAFNEKSCYAALSNEINRLYQQTKAMPPIQTLDWTPTNPNVLSLAYNDGSSKEVKVTKRSSDVSKDGMNIFSTEFRRVTDVGATSGGPSGVGGIPKIYASRLLSKWRQADNTNNLIEGIEIMYIEQGTMGETNNGVDPLFGGRYGQDTKDLSDWRSTKTKILMERIV